jgi:hypothetical protein
LDLILLGTEVHTAMTVKFTVFWGVKSYTGRRFGRIYRSKSKRSKKPTGSRWQADSKFEALVPEITKRATFLDVIMYMLSYTLSFLA